MFRLAHFTDLHVTEVPRAIRWRELLDKRLVGWANLRLRGRHERFREAEEITRALVADLRELAPDHLVFTGDVTGLSFEREFVRAREILGGLTEIAPITGIPGNHDVYVASAERDRGFERHFGDWMASDLGEGPPWIRLLGEDLALVALRDVRAARPWDSSGLVGPEQLARLQDRLRDPRLAERLIVLALHYGLRRGDGSADTRLHRLRDAEELLGIAAEGGVDLIVHGHLHDRIVLPRSPTLPVPIAAPGSATHSGHERAYHVLEVEQGTISLRARRFDPQARGFVSWPDAPGSGRIVEHS